VKDIKLAAGFFIKREFFFYYFNGGQGGYECFTNAFKDKDNLIDTDLLSKYLI